MEIDLKDADYVLTEGAAWFTVKNFSIRIFSTDEGVVVDIYKKGSEMDSFIAGTYAADDETIEE
jgi:hypothetical protein